MTILLPYIADDGFLDDVLGIDIYREIDTIKICKLKLLKLADIDFKEIIVGKVNITIDNVDGIIGRDILKDFREKQTMKLSLSM